MKTLTHRTLKPMLCLILLVSWSHAQDRSLSESTLPQAGESRDLNSDSSASSVSELVLPTPLFFAETNIPSLVQNLATTGHDVPPQPLVQLPILGGASPGFTTPQNTERFQGQFSGNSNLGKVGTDLYSAPEFKGGLIVFGEDVAMKIGGYVKTDFIYDFNPIDSTDSFATTSIPVGAPGRTNTRFHARQTRMSFDTRWAAGEQSVRVFVEGDFFSDSNGYRLRHAYGEIGSLLVGQTWTTFTDVSAAPATLDFEGSVSSVNRRQALVRWTTPIFHEDLTLAVAAENPRFIIVPPTQVTGDARSPSPDLVAHLRFSKEWGQFQIAHLYRLGGFQPTGGNVIKESAWGFNFTGTILLSENSKLYSQFVFGEGIGSYRGLPDAAPQSATTDELLGLTGWMIGYTRDWTETLNSNFTYAENSLDNTLFQQPDDVHRTTYLAANLIWKPYERVKVGIEYLYGLRENVDHDVDAAHRLQVAFIFDLP